MHGHSDWLRGVVAVAQGRGFVITAGGERYVVTAAHCLPALPPCASFTPPAEKTYPELLGPLGGNPVVPAACVFADPVADLALLGAPDPEELPEQSGAYRDLVQAADPLPVGAIASGARAASGVFLLTLDGRWFSATVSSQGLGLWIANAAEPIRGGSGSPIVTPEGIALGVLCTASSAEDYTSGGPNPTLAAHLPGWMLHALQLRTVAGTAPV